MEKTGERSEILDTKPVLGYSDELVWDVFCILHSSRPSGWSASGIPIGEIVAMEFATFESALDLVKIVKSLDSVWFEWYEEQQRKKG